MSVAENVTTGQHAQFVLSVAVGVLVVVGLNMLSVSPATTLVFGALATFLATELIWRIR